MQVNRRSITWPLDMQGQRRESAAAKGREPMPAVGNAVVPVSANPKNNGSIKRVEIAHL